MIRSFGSKGTERGHAGRPSVARSSKCLLFRLEVVALTMMTAREFSCDVSAAKREASRGPVVIADRGEAAYVLMSIDEYSRFGERGSSLVERLSMDGDRDIDFEPVGIRLRGPEL